jgi:hypothetical protein
MLPSESSQLLSVTDWKRTLTDAAEIESSPRDDSVSRFQSIWEGNVDSEPARDHLALQVWLEEDRYVLLYRFEDALFKIIWGYPYAPSGMSGSVSVPYRTHGGGQRLKPFEFPFNAMKGRREDFGGSLTCSSAPCLFNLDLDPEEETDLGASDTGAKQKGLELIATFKSLGWTVEASQVCPSGWHASKTEAATDANALRFAEKLGGFSAWLDSEGKLKAG